MLHRITLAMASMTTMGNVRRSAAELLAASLLAASLPAAAHHSVTATFDIAHTVTIEGEVRELQLTSPHSHLLVDVRAVDGKTTTWVTELAASPFLRRSGWTEKSLSVGERVRLTGAPSRFSARELYAITVTKADGTRLALLPIDNNSR